MNIFNYYGGTALAMTGKECLCIASDLRIGEQFETLAMDEPKIHKLTDKIYLAVGGFRTDIQTVVNRMQLRTSLYELRENRKIKPKVVSSLLSNVLYKHRFGPFFIEPIVAGLDPYTNEPFVCSMDSIGCISAPEDCVAVGTGGDFLLNSCEAYWRKDMNPDELFEATSQALLACIERDAASGFGAVAYLITKDKVVKKVIKSRMD